MRDRQVRDICEGGWGLKQKLEMKVWLNVSSNIYIFLFFSKPKKS
jgi:hypothetical protein